MGDAIASFLRGSGLEGRVEQARVLEEWAQAVGSEIAAVTEPRAVTADGTLLVAVHSHAWMSELSLREPELLRALERALPEVKVRRIRTILRRV